MAGVAVQGAGAVYVALGDVDVTWVVDQCAVDMGRFHLTIVHHQCCGRTIYLGCIYQTTAF